MNHLVILKFKTNLYLIKLFSEFINEFRITKNIFSIIVLFKFVLLNFTPAELQSYPGFETSAFPIEFLQ